MLSKLARGLAAALTLAAAAAANADLARVGPINTVNGYPKWYQDQGGQVLDLCMPNMTDPGGLQFTACLLELPPPYNFPTNFPDESFYFRAVSEPLAVGTGGQRAVLVLALEAAFASGAPAVGQQVVFTRIRVTAGVPFDGDYKVVHPYGEEMFFGVVSNGGNRDIVFTEDVGVTPGDFKQALNSRVGPFLRKADGTFVTLNGATFLSDGVALETVTGSPYGTNYFEICGPLNTPQSACYRTERFSLTGRVHDFVAEPIGSPLSIDRATYTRNGSGTSVDISATVIPGLLPNGSLQAAPRLSAGTAGMPPVLMNGPNNPRLGQYYAQNLPVNGNALPSSVTVINSADVPPSATSARIVDAVTVTLADYDPLAQTLVVVATSSDKGDGMNQTPKLILQGFEDAAAIPNVISGDPASMQFTVIGLAVPPGHVSVESQRGGEGRLAVSMARAPAFAPGVPWAKDDVASVTVSAAPVIVDARANDVADSRAPLFPGVTLLDTTSPFGTVRNLGDGRIEFQPGAVSGTATLRYTAANAVGTSNVATITIFVNPGAAGPVPITAPDTYTVNAGSGRTLDVLTNDSGNGGTLDPASVAIVSGPTNGLATVNPTGTISYTAPAVATTATLAYTVRNTNGNVSAPTTVTLNVIQPETVTVTRGRCSNNRWDVRGTSTVTNANTITLFLANTVPDNPTPAQILGSVPVDATGNWQFQLAGGPACRTPISAQSTLGTKVNNITIGR